MSGSRPTRSSVGSVRQNLARLREWWQAAGLPPEPLLPILDRYAARMQTVAEEKDQAADATRALAERVALGELSFHQSLIEHQRVRAGDEAAGTGTSMSRRTVMRDEVERAFGRLLVRDLREHTDELFGQVQAAHDELIAEATKALAIVGDVSDDGEAHRAGEKSAKAWRSLTAAADRRERILDAFAALIGIGAVTYLRDRPFGSELYRDVERLPKVAVDAPSALRLRRLLESGAEPAIISPAEVAEAEAERRRKAAALVPGRANP